MLRRSVLFLHRDSAGPEEKARMLHALAFLGMELPTVRAADYGEDLAGGSRRLLEVPPWTRPPRFRLRGHGPPCGFDVALHLDFEDEDALAAFDADPLQQAIARELASVTVDDLTARVDWRRGDEVPGRRGHVRHCSMHVWRDDADEGARVRARDALLGLTAEHGVEALAVADNAGRRATGYDWLLDVQLADADAACTFLGGGAFAAAGRAVADATKDEWTASVTHVMRAF